MGQGFVQRDSQLVLDKIAEAVKAVENLSGLQPSRELSETKTCLETGELWLKRLHDKTPASF